MIIKKVREHKFTKQKSITIPKKSNIETGDFIVCFKLDKNKIINLDSKLDKIKLKDIIKNE